MTDKNAPDDNNPIARRNFLLGASTAVAAGLAPTAPAPAQQPSAAAAAAPAADSEPATYLTLTQAEAAFFAAAVDTIIPADELTPSGTDCGIVTFIDRQLASAWGGGAKMYRNGPFRKAKPEYGYQLPLTPRQFFAAGIVATNAVS
jgi:gluconate 2-dehydrogenase gamma chain